MPFRRLGDPFSQRHFSHLGSPKGKERVNPTVVLSGTPGDPSYAVTATFSETVTGFVVGDLALVNCVASSFVAVSGTVYTFTITASDNGLASVQVPAGVCVDDSNNQNRASNTLSHDAIFWLLIDNFITAHAAPLTSPRPAEPGPGTLTLVQTDGNQSIANGVLVFPAQATPTWGDQGVYEATGYARVAGRILFAKILQDATNKYSYIGWNNTGNVATTSWVYNIYFYNDATIRQENASFTIGNYVQATQYSIAVVLRATGAFSFIKGGTFTNWTLLWITSTVTTTPVYPALGSYTASGTLDQFRVADLGAAAITSRALLLSDSFDAWPVADGKGHGEADGYGAGHTWGILTGWTASGGKAMAGPTPGAEVLTNGNFAAWTGDNPDGWTVTGEVAADPMVNEVGTGQGHGGAGTGFANLYSSGTNLQPRLIQTALVTGNWYQRSIVVQIVAGGIYVQDENNGLREGLITTSGTKVLTGRALGANAQIMGGNVSLPTDVTIDDFSIKSLTFTDLINVKDHGTPFVIIDAYPRITGNYQAGCVACYRTSDASCLLAYYNAADGKVCLDQYAAGTFSNLIAATATYSAGALLRLIVQPSGANLSVAVYYNNALIGTVQTITAASIIANTLHGMFSTNVAAQLDGFVVWGSGAADGRYDSLLNRYVQA